MGTHDPHGARDSRAFPYRQLSVLALCRICEPIAFMSIFPYIYYMIESFHVTDDETRIAFFAGLVTSVFAAAECIGAGFWGRMSDRFGRKPILLSGIAGTGISMMIFGFASNLPIALLARALGGVLNGNIGVIQTTVTETIKVEAHQARAFAIMPTVWCLGAIVGSILGGALADPVRNHPGTFRPGTIFSQFPYLLTNLVCAAVVIFSLLVGFLFLEETHEDKRHHRDVGLEMGNWLTGRPRRPSATNTSGRKGDMDDATHHLTYDDLPEYSSTVASSETCIAAATDLPPPEYRSHEGSPRVSLNAVSIDDHAMLELEDGRYRLSRPNPPAIANVFTKQVTLNIVGFGILAYHTISAEQLLPVLLSMPESDAPPTLPFRFSGGFALSTKTIGGILSVQGAMQMIATIVIFPVVTRRIGSLWTYRCAILSYPLLYLLVPYVTLLPDHLKLPAVYAVLAWKVTGQAFAFPSSSMMLANAASSTKVLGTLNGAAASAASASRAFGPTLSGLLQAAGLSLGALGLPWWTNVLVALGGAVISLLMREERRRLFDADETSCRPDGRWSVVSDDDNDAGIDLPDDTLRRIVESSNASCCDPLLTSPGSPLLARPSIEVGRSWSKQSSSPRSYPVDHKG